MCVLCTHLVSNAYPLLPVDLLTNNKYCTFAMSTNKKFRKNFKTISRTYNIFIRSLFISFFLTQFLLPLRCA